MYFWLRVTGSIDHFPSSPHWCCFKLRVYQRLIWKNGRIWGQPSITGAERLVFSLGPVTFDESPLKTPLGNARPAFALAQRHFLFPLSDCFWQDRLFFNVPQPWTHVVNYFSLLFVCSGWTTIHFRVTILNPVAWTSSDWVSLWDMGLPLHSFTSNNRIREHSIFPTQMFGFCEVLTIAMDVIR